MKEKKKAKDWYIAAIHFFIAGIVVPTFGGMGVLMLLVASEGVFGEPSDVTGMIIVSLFSLALIYIGAQYSVEFLRKRYQITNVSSVVRLSVIYFVVLIIIELLPAFIFPDPEFPMRLPHIVVSILYNIASVAVFYFSSKRFVKANV